MHPEIENYLKKLTNLAQLRAQNLPYEVLEALATMNEEELFKTCTQLYILQHNVPSKENLLNLDEDEILSGTTKYAEEILAQIQKN